MPPKIKITKENILRVSIDLVRKRGFSVINARDLAKELNCSTQPIFSNYDSMEALKSDIIRCAGEIYENYLQNEINKGEYPEYKACGMGYIRFAKEEKELFKLLFMRDRSKEGVSYNNQNWQNIVNKLKTVTGYDNDTAELFHLEMWIVVHGVATMAATSYMDMDDTLISRVLTDLFQSLTNRFNKEKK